MESLIPSPIIWATTLVVRCRMPIISIERVGPLRIMRHVDDQNAVFSAELLGAALVLEANPDAYGIGAAAPYLGTTGPCPAFDGPLALQIRTSCFSN
jgi:hypothetical protein